MGFKIEFGPTIWHLLKIKYCLGSKFSFWTNGHFLKTIREEETGGKLLTSYAELSKKAKFPTWSTSYFLSGRTIKLGRNKEGFNLTRNLTLAKNVARESTRVKTDIDNV